MLHRNPTKQTKPSFSSAMYAFHPSSHLASSFTAARHHLPSVCKRPRVSQVGRPSSLHMRSKDPLQLVRDAQKVYSAEKPPWCQPWTIVSTGAGAVAASWQIFQGWTSVIAVGVTAGVLLWWYLFLILYPQDVLGE